MEETGYVSFHISRRHTVVDEVSNFGQKKNSNFNGGYDQKWDDDQLQKESTGTKSTGGTSGFSVGFSKGGPTSANNKIESGQERTGEICHPANHDLQKGSGNPRKTAKFFNSPTDSQGFFRPFGAVHGKPKMDRVGSQNTHSQRPQGSSSGDRFPVKNLGREKFRGKKRCEENLLRLQHSRLGGSGFDVGQKIARILENRKGTPHQHKGAKGLHSSSAKLSSARRNRFLVSRQSSCLQLLKKGRRKIIPFQQFNATLFNMVLPKQGKFGPKLGKIRGHDRRRFESLGNGQGGLYPKKVHLSKSQWYFCSPQFLSHCGHVCQPWEQATGKICVPLATPPGHSSQCFGMQPRRILPGLCQPALETDFGLVDQAEEKSSDNLSDDSASLGWECLVAPVDQTARQKIPSDQGTASLGDVLQLPG